METYVGDEASTTNLRALIRSEERFRAYIQISS